MSTELELEAAMAAWEVCIDNPSSEMETVRLVVGTAAMRHMVGTLVPYILEGWEITDKDKWECYDWSFVPYVLHMCVDWKSYDYINCTVPLKPNWKEILNA